jgi:predicted flavoprotein YhiN
MVMIGPLAVPDHQLGDKGDAVFLVQDIGHALTGTRPGEVEFEIVPAHAETAADDGPQRPAGQFVA